MLIGGPGTLLDAFRLGAAILLAAAAALAAALAYEHLGGYAPCPLCLVERYAYYFALPAASLALLLLWRGAAGGAALFLAIALVFLANAGLGAYHAGAEWKFWAGPPTCGGLQPIASSPDSLLEQLRTARVIRCDEAPWRLAGLSFAGWNAVISLALFLGAASAARQASGPSRG